MTATPTTKELFWTGFTESKSFVLTAICTGAVVYIIYQACSNRDSPTFWLSWQGATLFASGLAALAFWGAAFFWPPEHFSHTSYSDRMKYFCFLIAIIGSGLLIYSGHISKTQAETMKHICNKLASNISESPEPERIVTAEEERQIAIRKEKAREAREAIATDLSLQPLMLTVGIFCFCLVQVLFLWGTRKNTNDDVKPLRNDYWNCLKFSDGPCCIVFFIFYLSIGRAEHSNHEIGHLVIYNVFIAGAVSVQVTLSNIVYILEFSEGKRLRSSLYSFFLALRYGGQFIWRNCIRRAHAET